MIGTSQQEKSSRPPGQVVLRCGTIAAGLVVGVVLGRAILLFPFEPHPSPVQSGFALVAVGVFLAGLFLALLGGRLEQRFGAVHLLAAGSALLLIVLAGDGFGWTAVVLVWGAAAGMSFWGTVLARRLVRERAEKGRPT